MSERWLGLPRGLAALLIARGLVFVAGAVLAFVGHPIIGVILLSAVLVTTLIPGPFALSRDHWVDGWGNEVDGGGNERD